jgi:hypothetical protein
MFINNSINKKTASPDNGKPKLTDEKDGSTDLKYSTGNS